MSMTPQAQSLWNTLQELEAAITANDFPSANDIALHSDIVQLKKNVVVFNQHLANTIVGNDPNEPLVNGVAAVVPAVS